MSTFIYLLVSVIVLFIISRVMYKNNRIDAFTRLLGSLAFGLLLGAGVQYFTSNEQPEKSAMVTTASMPIQQVDCDTANIDSLSVVSQATIEDDTEVTHAEGITHQRRIVEIEDDS